MTLTLSSFLHSWSSRHGAIPLIGGKPVHSRSGAARWDDGQGILQSAIVNTPRFRPDWIASERRSVLRLEGARTNEWTYSEDLTQSVWAKDNTSVSANSVLAPDGTLTADKVIEDSATTDHGVTRDLTGATDNTSQTISASAKAGTRSWVFLRIVTKASAEKRAWFNLGTGAWGTVDSGVTTFMEPLAFGFYRIGIAASAGSGGATARGDFMMTTGDGVATHVGDGASYLYLWGLDWEKDRTSMSAYIATTTASASRVADSFYWDYTPAPQAMMVYSRHVERGTILDTAISPGVWHIGSDNGISPLLQVLYPGGGTYRLTHNNGSAAVFSTLAAGPVYGDTVELLAILQADGAIRLVQSINGAAVTAAALSAANALATAWQDSRLYLNLRPTTDIGTNDFAEVKIVKYADVAASTDADRMAELRAVEITAQGELAA